MCRLFGVIALEPTSPAPWLLEGDIPLLRQANVDPETPQGEGWGIGWFEGRDPKPRVVKGAEAVFHPRERERFSATARSCSSALVIAHLRKASNPLRLPREQLVALENSQPFVSDGSLFAHNGWIPLPRETRPRLGSRAEQVRGVNDSEVLQQLFLHHLDRDEDPVRAYADAMRDLHEVWESVGRPPTGPHGGLNLLFSRGPGELWAFCHYTGTHGSCLSGLPRPYYEMSYVAEPGRVVVASEPTDRHLERWRPIRSGQYLRVRRTEGALETLHAEVPGLPRFPEGVRAVEPSRVPLPA